MRQHPANRGLSRPTVLHSDWTERRILVVRGQQVLLDADLAHVFGVATRTLNQAVRRHHRRFPIDFMFKLKPSEAAGLRSQIVISNSARGGRRYLPNVFTEHGAVMAATLLNSPVAVNASIQVVRAFVRLRSRVAEQRELVRQLEQLEASCDKRFTMVFRAIRRLVAPTGEPARRRIGFGHERSLVARVMGTSIDAMLANPRSGWHGGKSRSRRASAREERAPGSRDRGPRVPQERGHERTR